MSLQEYNFIVCNINQKSSIIKTKMNDFRVGLIKTDHGLLVHVTVTSAIS